MAYHVYAVGERVRITDDVWAEVVGTPVAEVVAVARMNPRVGVWSDRQGQIVWLRGCEVALECPCEAQEGVTMPFDGKTEEILRATVSGAHSASSGVGDDEEEA